MPTAFINGLTVNYLRLDGRSDTGPRPVAVFVHGLGTDSLASFYLTLAAPVSAAGIDVLAYDLRGHGRSGRPPEGYTLADFTADLTGLLDELAVDRPVHLVGNSFGGTLAFAVAAAHPDRVASVVSIESEPPTPAWADRLHRTLRAVKRDLAREDTYLWLASTFGNHHARLSRQAYDRMCTTTMVEDIPRGPLLGLADLDRIACPVLSIIGDEGFQADDPHLLETLLRTCRTVIIDDQDHSVLVEAHREVRRLVIDWVYEFDPAAETAGVVPVPWQERAG
ncbi:MAG: Hydrolase [Actinomycetota bacterium]|nr:Hydrolase [Actinomycetota bacterium]